MIMVRRRFNFYLFSLLVAALAAAGLAGCAARDAEGRKRKPVVLRLHLESYQDVAERLTTVEMGRAVPFTFKVERTPFLKEEQIIGALLVEDMGLYSIRITLDHQGGTILNQVTSGNPGRRIAVYAEFDEIRWIGAVLPERRITSGELTFTPDMSKEEAERIVDGVNYYAELYVKARR